MSNNIAYNKLLVCNISLVFLNEFSRNHVLPSVAVSYTLSINQ